MRISTRVYFLGAGFSVPAGLPAAAGLLELVLEAADREDQTGLDFHWIRDAYSDFNGYWSSTSTRRPDIEDFVSFLDAKALLQLDPVRGNATATRSQLDVRVLIARVLWDAQQRATPTQLDLYSRFVSRLQSSDVICTLNYDTLLEAALERSRVAYRLNPFPARPDGTITGLQSGSGVTVLKLHGSIDWFDMSDWKYSLESRASSRARLNHLVPGFRTDEAIDINAAPPDDDPRFGTSLDEFSNDTSGLRRICRARSLDNYFRSDREQLSAPFIVAPSAHKLATIGVLANLWRALGLLPKSIRRLSIVGFSMPEYDHYVRIPMVQMAEAIRTERVFDAWGAPVRDSVVDIVDYRKNGFDQKELRRRFDFIDASKMRFWNDGFSTDALDWLDEVNLDPDESSMAD